MGKEKKVKQTQVTRYTAEEILQFIEFKAVDRAFLKVALDPSKEYSIDEAKKELENILKGVVK